MLRINNPTRNHEHEFKFSGQVEVLDKNGTPVLYKKGPKKGQVKTKEGIGTFKMFYQIMKPSEYMDMQLKYIVNGELPPEGSADFMVELNNLAYVGWEGLKDATTGEDIKFKSGIIEYLDFIIQSQLFSFYREEIIEPLFEKTAALAKNLESILG